MSIAKQILTILFAIFMIVGGVGHFLNPSMYLPFIPDYLPGLLIIYISGVVETLLGVGALIPKTSHYSKLGILLLMIAFLPLHIIDVFKEFPAVGSHYIAMIRLPIQFFLIAWAWFIYRD